jgi:hypothetical protein
MFPFERIRSRTLHNIREDVWTGKFKQSIKLSLSPQALLFLLCYPSTLQDAYLKELHWPSDTSRLWAMATPFGPKALT